MPWVSATAEVNAQTTPGLFKVLRTMPVSWSLGGPPALGALDSALSSFLRLSAVTSEYATVNGSEIGSDIVMFPAPVRDAGETNVLATLLGEIEIGEDGT